MYTVCGQAQPHQTRPYTAVTQEDAEEEADQQEHEQHGVGRQKGGAEEREVARFTTSSWITGLPPIRRYGITVKSPISTQARAPPAPEEAPLEELGAHPAPRAVQVERGKHALPGSRAATRAQ